MNLKSLFSFKKIYTAIYNLKYYISWNLISLIGYLDIGYCIYFYKVITGPDRFSVADILLIFTFCYSILTRTVFMLFLILFVIEKIKKLEIQEHFLINNVVYNLFFYLGLISFVAISLLILFLIIYFLLF